MPVSSTSDVPSTTAEQQPAGVPVLAKLRAKAQSLADAELKRTLAVLGPLSEPQRESVCALASAIVDKLLHRPTTRLHSDGGPLARAAAELFGLADSVNDHQAARAFSA